MYANGKAAQNISKEIPVENIVWTTNTKFTDSTIVFYTLTIMWHVLPAMLIDAIIKFYGSKPMYV